MRRIDPRGFRPPYRRSRQGFPLIWLLVAIGLFGVGSRAVADDIRGKASKPAPAKPTVKAEPHEFIDDARELLVVGACAEGKQTKVNPEIVGEHCKSLRVAQDDYKKSWIAVASEWFKTHVPTGVSKTVVYPFAGGDLSSALTVYPDADEITTLSLEPAGDPRALSKLSEAEIKKSLGIVSTELSSLYESSFSKTMNMISSMRSGQLPTQLIFSLSALWLHGYEPTSLRYFKLDGNGDIVYLTDGDLARIDAVKDAGAHNRLLGNIELRFHKLGSKREQLYRHIMANLDNVHVKASPSALRHLEKKGHVAGMTKAASYLLSYNDFSIMRKYVLDHIDWMVSDTTGVPPPYGEAAGFEYEAWGEWTSSNMPAGNGSVAPLWKTLFKAQPTRELKFRFGYADGQKRNNLVIMRRRDKPDAPPAQLKRAPIKPPPVKPSKSK